MSDEKTLVQRQFGRTAQDYVTSRVHASGEDLRLLVDMADAQPAWQALDVATGGGHTALALAPLVAHVVASDLTEEMLVAAAGLAAERGIDNVSFEAAKAEALPFADGRFDLVACRVAAHHFDSIPTFLDESARVLKAHGTLVISDNTVPDGEAGDYINAYESLRDPSHAVCYSAELWEQALFASGFELHKHDVGKMRLNFHNWCERMRVSAENRVRLKAMLHQAPEPAKAVLNPHEIDGALHFELERTVMLAKRRA